jgi:hypothetical protein
MNLRTKFRLEQANCWTPDPNSYKFQDDWKVNSGSAEVTFQGKGRDVYIKLQNQKNDSSHQYWLVVAGWENTKSRLTRGNGAEVCFTNSAALDLNKQYNYRVSFDKATSTVSVFLDGNLYWSCKDNQGWNANDAQYFSISRYSGANFQICNFQSSCWTPDPNAYKFNEDWKVGPNGAEITFKGKGRDVYIKTNNAINNGAFGYWIVINGWDNTQSRVTRADDSVVCQPNVSAVNLNNWNDYKVQLDSYNASISVWINGQLSFSCTDSKGWQADNAKYYSISRFSGANFEICNLRNNQAFDVCWTPDPNSYKFQNNWKLGENGAAEITFKGKGRDLYIKTNNAINNGAFGYWIVINGWDNTQSRITRADDSVVCQPNVSAVNLNNMNDYKVQLDPLGEKISVWINGQLSFSCNDSKGWQANDAKYYSISRFGGANFEICNQRTNINFDSCFTPDPNSYKFQNNWTLGANGSADITFKGKGRDVYFKTNNAINNGAFGYWIVINGWDNTQSRITRADDSVVCQPNVSALDLNKDYNYKVQLNPYTATISVWIDGKLSFSCTDSKGWQAADAKYYSISRFSGANFNICNVRSTQLADECFTPNPSNYKFQDNWALKNGGGEISFKGKGRDLYIQANQNSNKVDYWLVLNGWDNKQSRITRDTDSSVVCQPNVSALDLGKWYDYKVILDRNNASFKVLIDGKESFSCKDNSGWKANGAQKFSISRYSGANFEMCNVFAK